MNLKNVLRLLVFSIGMLVEASQFTRGLLITRSLRSTFTSLRILTPIRTLFYKKNAGQAEFGTPVFSDQCCKQQYYRKDSKVYRLTDHRTPMAEDIIFGGRVTEIDGHTVFETNPVPEEDKERIQYLQNIIIPYGMFPVIGFREERTWLRGHAHPQFHYIALSCDMRKIVDGILAKKEIITLQLNDTFTYFLPLELTKMVIEFYMLHEAGHIYHQHHIIRDKLVPYQYEREADAFAAQSWKGIIGGLLTAKIQNETMLNNIYIAKIINERAKHKSVPVKEKPLEEKRVSFEDLKAWYFFNVSKSEKPLYLQHPSWIEREYFFREELEKFLQKNPSYYSRYEAIKDDLKTDYKVLV